MNLSNELVFQKFLSKVNQGEWEDLAYMSIVLEQDLFSKSGSISKKEKKTYLTLLDLIDQKKSSLVLKQKTFRPWSI